MTVYLLHFERPYFHARHYLGWTDNGVETRVTQHLCGDGSPLVRAVVNAGIPVTLARTWQGDRTLERTLKNSKAVPRNFCPICRAARQEAAA